MGMLTFTYRSRRSSSRAAAASQRTLVLLIDARNSSGTAPNWDLFGSAGKG
jgi:hypothetical protein